MAELKRQRGKNGYREPPRTSPEWIHWAAWADRISFEKIKRVTGLREADVIRWMRRHVSRAEFRRWRRRVNGRPLLHHKRFVAKRRSKASALETDHDVERGGGSCQN